MRKVSKSGDSQNIWYKKIKIKTLPIADSRLVFLDASKPWTRKQCCITWLGWFPLDQLGANGLLKLVQRRQYELSAPVLHFRTVSYSSQVRGLRGSQSIWQKSACITNSRLVFQDTSSLRQAQSPNE